MKAPHDVVIVRHGETEWSASGQHTSYSDIALTERGREEAAALRARLTSWKFALVLTSPRRRACTTCELAGLARHAHVDEDLAEWDYGEYEGRTTAQIRERDPGWTIFSGDPPGGETAAQVSARADRVLARADAADGPVALFSHGHFLRVLGARWIALGARDGRLLGLDTATMSVLGHERDQRVLRRWNSGA
jgi:probable phosphoglycerate mutase